MDLHEVGGAANRLLHTPEHRCERLEGAWAAPTFQGPKASGSPRGAASLSLVLVTQAACAASETTLDVVAAPRAGEDPGLWGLLRNAPARRPPAPQVPAARGTAQRVLPGPKGPWAPGEQGLGPARGEAAPTCSEAIRRALAHASPKPPTRPVGKHVQAFLRSPDTCVGFTSDP